MIAVDTNILVYAHRADAPWHTAAMTALERAAQGTWSIPWPCIHEFLAVVTHPRIFDPPTPLASAIKTILGWLASPTVHLLSELDTYWETLAPILTASQVVGPRVHDARIAALCAQHAVTELWTVDRDFSRFPSLRTHNPLV